MSPRQQITSAGYAIRAENVDSLPKGIVVMWSGRIADIPSGWALCDGTNGTPDLRDKFVVGAKQDDGGVAKTNIAGSLAQSGGSVTISEANLPSHAHAAGSLTVGNESAHTHGIPVGVQGEGGYTTRSTGELGYISSQAGSSHTHSLSGSTGTIGSGTAYAQPYYALAYIMKI